MIRGNHKDAENTSPKSDEKALNAAVAPPGDVADAAADAGSKKRTREDDGAEEQGNTKRVDSKADGS